MKNYNLGTSFWKKKHLEVELNIINQEIITLKERKTKLF